MFREKTFMDRLSFRKQQSPSLRVLQSILNINFFWITSHHMCLRIPLFLVIFQLLQQTFSYFWFCIVFLGDNWSKYFFFFFLSGFSFMDTDDSQNSRGREGTILYSTLPLPPTHEHWDIYLQLCMWDDYHIFLITMLLFTRLLLDEILPSYWITIWLIDDVKFVLVCLFDNLILGFC